MFSLFLGMFLITNIYLFTKNKTQWENWDTRENFNYSRGCLSNWKEIMGSNIFTWLIPYSPYHGVDPLSLVYCDVCKVL